MMRHVRPRHINSVSTPSETRRIATYQVISVIAVHYVATTNEIDAAVLVNPVTGVGVAK
jgi:hypothetical protein